MPVTHLQLFNDSTYTDNVQIYNGDTFRPQELIVELRNGSRARGELDNIYKAAVGSCHD
jgi:hypothetical protein